MIRQTSFPYLSNPLFDHAAAKISVYEPLICALRRLPEFGVCDACILGKAHECLAFVDRQRPGGCRVH